jgi:hypothetical protein
MNAIAKAEPANTNVAPLAESSLAGSLLNFVAAAMQDPSINVDKLQMLLSMQREIIADDARLQFNRAMSKAQGEMQPVVRDAQNTQTNSKYARLETIDAAIRPIYTRNGFCLEFNSEAIEGPNERIVCEVSHTAGHSKRYQLEAAPDTAGPQGKANKTPLHGLGSTVSYLRRYLTCMIFNITLANEDNDGNRRQRDDGEISSRPQVQELYALLAACSADPNAVAANERAFLTKMGLGDLRTMADARVGDFPRLRNALLTKRAIMTKRAANDTQTGAAA